MAENNRILVVEDESHLAMGLKLNLELEGYAVDVVSHAKEASAKLLGPSYDAIILDVALPDLDGFTLCQRIRDAGNFTPVLMLTARSAAEDRVSGLDAGADDYLTKPFELKELLARVQALLRRRAWDRPREDRERSVLCFGRARVNFDTHEATVDDAVVRMTALELDLLRYFALHPGRVISREELLEEVWKLHNYPNTRTVDNFIVRLRRHFESDPATPEHFISVRGSGYKFVPDPAGG